MRQIASDQAVRHQVTANRIDGAHDARVIRRQKSDQRQQQQALSLIHIFDVTTARTAFYPTVNLTGSAGYQAPALNALISPGGFIASLAAGLTAPIFDAGALRLSLIHI